MKGLLPLLAGLAIVGAAVILMTSRPGRSETSPDYEAARQSMVDRQIASRGVKDPRVLKALRRVPRHRFVPAGQRRYAYEDRPLPIGEGQTISQPYIVALMTEKLEPRPEDTVLEIGTGSGYQAAVLCELVKHVYTIEIVEVLADRARKTLTELGYKNVTVKAGDGYVGWKEHAPFDATIVTCAPDHIPQPLVDQLREGGRMVIPVGDFSQELILLKKEKGQIVKTDIIPVLFVPMTGESVKTKGR
jgi:protein-L-isoaspartate(D-aspartate) O-methyltransferase